jgi:biopolymer transport protein ExbB/TolQ
MARGVLSVKTNPVLSKKMLPLINDSGTLGLALGFFSAFLGLITGFDAIEASGNAEPAILAGGIKVALLSPLFGLFTFIVSRVGMLLLKLLQKN